MIPLAVDVDKATLIKSRSATWHRRGCIVDDKPSIIAPITTNYCSLIKLIQPLGFDSEGFTSVIFSIQT